MDSYRMYLKDKGLSMHTIDSYDWTAEYFVRNYGTVTKGNLLDYQEFLMRKYSPKTVNQRIQALNTFVTFSGQQSMRLKCVKVQQRSFLDEVIDEETYDEFKTKLWEGGYLRDYFAVWTMAVTGLRVSELLELVIEDVRQGYADVTGKGGKVRRVYFPHQLQKALLAWFRREGRTNGYLFLNAWGSRITARGLAQQLKTRAREFGLNEQVIHPHAFRHFMARKFLDAHGDIVLLADLLGHSSINTTRVYLRRTSEEQQKAVEAIVNW